MGQQSSNQLLLATKLTIPPVRSDLVARPRLVRALEACMQHPLTLLAAPAGFGKTALLSAWARERQRSLAWVSLDRSENDPAQFWSYVLAALDALHPGLGATALYLQSTQTAPIDTVLVELINNVSALPQHIVLILDDYHLIEELSIHRAMSFLLLLINAFSYWGPNPQNIQEVALFLPVVYVVSALLADWLDGKRSPKEASVTAPVQSAAQA